MKRCSQCGRVKPLTEFYMNGTAPECKECAKTRMRLSHLKMRTIPVNYDQETLTSLASWRLTNNQELIGIPYLYDMFGQGVQKNYFGRIARTLIVSQGGYRVSTHVMFWPAPIPQDQQERPEAVSA